VFVAPAPPGSAPRAVFTAAPAVVNATNATAAAGVLALQLAAPFATLAPVKLTVYSDPGRPVQHAAALGSGDVVLANGTTTGGPGFEAAGGAGGGHVVAMWVDAPSVTITSAGCAGLGWGVRGWRVGWG
jgi:hypothetical protein